MSKNTFIETWRSCSFEDPPYIFPGDDSLLGGKNLSTYHSFADFTNSADFGLISDKKLHLGLLPAPFRGNLEKASIFILLLNPGLSPADYYAEYESNEFRAALLRTLRQQNSDDDYPFTSLDPRFSWQNKYWTQKLQGVIEELMKQNEGMSYRDALRMLAQNIACIQFVPYHSKKFGLTSSLQKQLASSKAAVDYVNQVLVPRAKQGNAVIIATRKVREWGLPTHENIIAYTGIEALAAHLTPNSPAGKTIMDHLTLIRSSPKTRATPRATREAA